MTNNIPAWDHDGARTPRDFGPSTPLTYLIDATHVLDPISTWNWGQVTSTPGLGGLASLPQLGWLTQGITGQVVLLDTPPYTQKNLYHTDWKNFQPRLGLAYAFNDKTDVHASAGIIDQGLDNPNDSAFGGVMGKNGQRIMQIGARIFF